MTGIPITDRRGNPLTSIGPFRDGPTNDPRVSADTRGGRPAADEVGGTPYGRPEDMEAGFLGEGKSRRRSWGWRRNNACADHAAATARPISGTYV